MQCPDCKQLRHNGPCDPVYEDKPDDLEMLQIDMERSRERYLSELLKRQKEHSHESR